MAGRDYASDLGLPREYPFTRGPYPTMYKVSHCSKTEGGADAFGAFTSVLRTLARKGGGQSVVDGLCGVFSGAPVHARST